MDLVQFTRGSVECKIIERDLSQDRADSLADEIRVFNEENASGCYYRAIMA